MSDPNEIENKPVHFMTLEEMLEYNKQRGKKYMEQNGLEPLPVIEDVKPVGEVTPPPTE